VNDSLKESNILFTLKYSKRKTLSIAVLPDLSVLVTAPHNMDLDSIQKKVEDKRAWINKQLKTFKNTQQIIPARKYISGESYPFLGKLYRLKLHKLDTIDSDSGRRLIKNRTEFHIYSDDLSVEAVKAILEAWYMKQAEKHFSCLLNTAFKKFLRHYKNSLIEFHAGLSAREAGLVSLKSIVFPKLRIKKMKTRWGSLSKQGLLSLNLELIKLDLEFIEYVIFHELCHLVYFDHSKEFFALLYKILPNADSVKYRLDKLGSHLHYLP